MRTGKSLSTTASATEESARESAEGAVQEKSYQGNLPQSSSTSMTSSLHHGLEG